MKVTPKIARVLIAEACDQKSEMHLSAAIEESTRTWAACFVGMGAPAHPRGIFGSERPPWVAVSLTEGRTASYHPTAGTVVEANFRVGNRRFRFTTKVVGYGEHTDDLRRAHTTIRLGFPESMEEVQQRTHFRVSAGTSSATGVTVRFEGYPTPHPERFAFSGEISNISEGGLELHSRGVYQPDLDKHDRLWMSFYLPGSPSDVRCVGLIRSMRRTALGRLVVGIEFAPEQPPGATPDLIDRIHHFVASRQREILKRKPI